MAPTMSRDARVKLLSACRILQDLLSHNPPPGGGGGRQTLTLGAKERIGHSWNRVRGRVETAWSQRRRVGKGKVYLNAEERNGHVWDGVCTP